MGKRNRRLALAALLVILACGLALYAAEDTVHNPSLIAEAVMTRFAGDTGAENAVASIYLNYRIFDTIFEALMLLVSVMGVIHFSRHEQPEDEEESH